MEQDLAKLLERLIQTEVEFVLVGGFAAVAHGCTIVTQDVDVAITLEQENLRKLWTALDGTNPRFRALDPPRPFTEGDAQDASWKNLYLQTDLGPLDCLGKVAGVGGYRECFENSVEWDLKGRKIRILDVRTLIASKRAIGRPRDLQTITQLELLQDLDETS